MPISRAFLSLALVILLSCGVSQATPVRSGEYVAVVADGQWWWLAPEKAGNGTLLELRNSGPAVSSAFNMTQGVPVSNNTTFFITKVDGSPGEVHSGDYVRIRGINSDYFGNDPYLMVEGSDTNRVRVATPRGPKFVDGDPTIFFIDGLGQNVIHYGAPFIIRGTARGTTWFVTYPANIDEHIYFTADPNKAARFSFHRPSTIALQDNASFRKADEGGCGAGWSKNFLGICFPNCGGDLCNALSKYVNEAKAQTLGNNLAIWMIASRNSAIGSAQPIPADVRAKLTGKVPENILNRARYKIDDNGFFNLGGLTVRYGDNIPGNEPGAITLDDLIIFSPNAVRTDSLWAHELYHVKQYAEWGVRDFAIRYARDFDAVEKPAYEEGARYPN